MYKTNLDFSINLNFSPSRDTLSIGDTIIINSFAPVRMVDTSSGSEVLFEGSYSFRGSLSVNTIESPNILGPGLRDFEYIFDKGTEIAGDTTLSKSFYYHVIPSGYELKIKMIARRRGIYCLITGDSDNNKSSNLDACDQAALHYFVSNSDPHEHYFQDLYFQGAPIPDNVKGKFYCFVVN